MSTELAVRQPNAGLVPTNIDQALQLATIMSKGSLVPMHLRDKDADCFLVVDIAARWGMSPFAVAQATSVISGKLMFEGKLVAAVINSRGDLDVRLDYRFEGEGDRLKCYPFATLRGEDKPREIAEGVELSKVRTGNEMWRRQPHQQLTYAAARIWARRHMPELMLGVYTPDEDIEGGRSQASAVDIAADFEKAAAAVLEPVKEDAGPKDQTATTLPAQLAHAGTTDTAVPAASGVEVPAKPTAISGPDEFRDLVECWTWKEHQGKKSLGGVQGEWISIGMQSQRSKAQNSKIHALKGEIGIKDADWRERLAALFNKDSSAELSEAEAGTLIDKLEQRLRDHGTTAQKEARQKERGRAVLRDVGEGLTAALREPGSEG